MFEKPQPIIQSLLKVTGAKLQERHEPLYLHLLQELMERLVNQLSRGTSSWCAPEHEVEETPTPFSLRFK